MLFNWLQKNIKHVPPYEKLAPIYDFLMRHVDYQMWAEHILSIYKKLHFSPESLLDTSCGTGSFLANLSGKITELYGCDGSFPMIRQARMKEKLNRIPLWVNDMRRFGLKKQVDAIVCLYDSINYLKTSDEILLALENFYETVKERGVLIFDICTIQNSELNFSNYYEVKKENGFSYTRRSRFDRKKHIQITEFQIKFKNDPRLYHEVHRQRIYPTELFFDLIEKTNWTLKYALDGFSFDAAHQNSNRIHFVLIK